MTKAYFLFALFAATTASSRAAEIGVNLARYTPACGVAVKGGDKQIHVSWPTGDKRQGEFHFDLREDRPLIASLSGVLHDLDPFVSITAGTRVAK